MSRPGARRLGSRTTRPAGGGPPALLAAFVAAASAACAGSGGLRDEPLDRGETLAFEAPSERVYEVARTAVIESGLRIDREYREDESTRVILATNLLGEDELAAFVRVVVRRSGEARTAVTVLSRRSMPTEITFGGDPWADRLFGEMVPRLIEGASRDRCD